MPGFGSPCPGCFCPFCCSPTSAGAVVLQFVTVHGLLAVGTLPGRAGTQEPEIRDQQLLLLAPNPASNTPRAWAPPSQPPPPLSSAPRRDTEPTGTHLLHTMEMATRETMKTTPAAAEPAIRGSCSLSSDL